MTNIHLITKIKAPIQTVFDLSRNIDAHTQSAFGSNEKAIEGRTSGLIELGETVTWRGKHFGLYLKHKSRITAMENPHYFIDEMEKGHFQSFRHEHVFSFENGFTIMTDNLQYQTPYGILGKWFDDLFLKQYLENFLVKRNEILQKLSENQQ